MEPYCKKLRDLREDSDLTQKQVADVLGTSQTMYARYERGANDLPIRHLTKLCNLYHVSADYILGIKNETDDSSDSFLIYSRHLTQENQKMLKSFERFLLNEQKNPTK